MVHYLTVCVFFVIGMLAASGMVRQANAQQRSSKAVVEVGALAGTADSLPFWLHANQSSRFDPASANAYTRLGFYQSSFAKSGKSGWSYGLEALGRYSNEPAFFLTEAYVEGRLTFMVARLGRRIETLGTIEEGLSMGSLATGTNAVPIPKLVLRSDGYVDVPFTGGLLAVKGYFAHGWFRDDRYARNSYLHQKNIYGRLRMPGRAAWQAEAYVGIVHDAFWGGYTEDHGDLPDGLDDWARVVLGMSASDGPRGERIYVQGNHLGIYDAGLAFENDRYRLAVYRHFIFDDKDGLKLKNPGDGLLGVVLADGGNQARGIVSRVVYEYLYTKWQSGPERVGSGRDGPGGQDDYYNHYIYRSGWTHYGRTISNPLFLPYPDGEIRFRRRIENNRIVAHHVGVDGAFRPGLDYRLLATYSRNYGNYRERDEAIEREIPYRYDGGLQQISVLAEVTWRNLQRLPVEICLGLAIDTGELFESSAGGRLAVRYVPTF